MRNTMKAAVLSLLLGTAPLAAFAGVRHDHGHSHESVPQAEMLATASVAQLAASGKVDASWKSIGVAKSEQKEFKGSKEWVISSKNTGASAPTKQTLYIFLTLGGEYLAANYMGN